MKTPQTPDILNFVFLYCDFHPSYSCNLDCSYPVIATNAGTFITATPHSDFTSRLLSVQSENVALRSDLSQAQADLSSQVETQRQTYREQLRKLQDDHRATVETLQGQLTRVEEQLFNLQSQNSKYDS